MYVARNPDSVLEQSLNADTSTLEVIKLKILKPSMPYM